MCVENKLRKKIPRIQEDNFNQTATKSLINLCDETKQQSKSNWMFFAATWKICQITPRITRDCDSGAYVNKSSRFVISSTRTDGWIIHHSSCLHRACWWVKFQAASCGWLIYIESTYISNCKDCMCLAGSLVCCSVQWVKWNGELYKCK